MLAFIFDPNLESAEEIARVISQTGLKTRIIKSLAEFISSLQAEIPKLIICEAIVRGYDDFILLEHIKKDRQLHQIPVIITTSQATRENILRARKLGADGFITKPFDKANLIKQIKLALNIRDLNNTEFTSVQIGKKLGTQHKLSLKTINDERLKSQLMQKIEEIPSLPAIVYKIIALVNSDKSNASDFEAILARDQALTARMLRMANSSFYSLSRKVSSISEAVVYLGHNTIRSLVLGVSTSSIFKHSLPVYDYQRDGLWQHANIVASLSKKIAAAAHLTSEGIENCYVSGLMHDIGKLILGPFIQKESKNLTLLLEQGKTLSEAERELLGFSHGEIGRILLDKWKLPRNLVETVHYHHQPEASTYSPRETLTVYLADSISNQFGFSLEREKPNDDPAAFSRRLQRLGLDPQWPEQQRDEIVALAENVNAILTEL
ncbi:MAG TPA: response regulator [Proteobacteria bacterium]|nr:response regulator [Pseudomonadota bacterium]